MPVITEKFSVKTKGFTDIIDITRNVQEIVSTHEITQGQVLVYVMGSTASVTTIEYEPGLIKDFPEALEVFAPQDKSYHHDDTWHDGNGYAHVRAAILGSSRIFPVENSVLMIGTWQQIVLVDFDNRSRVRTIVTQIVY